MRVQFFPSRANGKVVAPASKSLSHRYLIAAGLSENKSVISGLQSSKDIEATIACLRAFGCEVHSKEDVIEMEGFHPNYLNPQENFFCDESGSTLRFLIPIALLMNQPIIFQGSKRLFERPLDVYEKICKEQGLIFDKSPGQLVVCGKLGAGSYQIKGDISSQFISGLLFALPLLDGDSSIEIVGEIKSEPYVHLTMDVLKHFGITMERKENQFFIPGQQRYQAGQFHIEGDYSNAAFLDALNLIGGCVEISGLSKTSLQGDKVYQQLFPLLKGSYQEIDLSNCPDLGPILFVVAALFHGAKFKGIENLRIKESDRVLAMTEELSKFGIYSEIQGKELSIFSGKLTAPNEVINSHNDHRIAMALSILMTKMGGELEDAEAVEKSFPKFFQLLQELKIDITVES